MATDSPTATHGYSLDKDAYVKRLRRIEGQVRGLQRMVETDTYCIDILTQVSAVTKALQSVAVGLLDQHVRHCVTQRSSQRSRACRRDGRRSHQGNRAPAEVMSLAWCQCGQSAVSSRSR